MKHMFSEVEMARDVAICCKDLKSQSSPHQQILSRLLKDLIRENACREHGIYLGITALKSISNNTNNDDNNQQEQVLTFQVSFTCRTFFPAKGHILKGIVTKVISDGAYISSGPLRYAYLPSVKMSDYQYFLSESEEEKSYFQKDDLTKIAVGVVVRFKVWAVGFKKRPDKSDFYVLATIKDNDTLGPISLTGSDEPYM